MNTWTAPSGMDALAPALVAALGSLEEVHRNRIVDAGPFKYRYVDLAAVMTAVRPILASHDIALIQTVEIADGDVIVITTLLHASGEFLISPPLRLPAGQTAQSAGSAISYSRRYATLAILGLAAGDDDDDGQGTARVAPQAVLSEQNVERFLAAAAEAGLSGDEISSVVLTATDGRTNDPAAVRRSEIGALRQALDEATIEVEPEPDEDDDEVST